MIPAESQKVPTESRKGVQGMYPFLVLPAVFILPFDSGQLYCLELRTSASNTEVNSYN